MVEIFYSGTTTHWVPRLVQDDRKWEYRVSQSPNSCMTSTEHPQHAPMWIFTQKVTIFMMGSGTHSLLWEQAQAWCLPCFCFSLHRKVISVFHTQRSSQVSWHSVCWLVGSLGIFHCLPHSYFVPLPLPKVGCFSWTPNQNLQASKHGFWPVHSFPPKALLC